MAVAGHWIYIFRRYGKSYENFSTSIHTSLILIFLITGPAVIYATVNWNFERLFLIHTNSQLTDYKSAISPYRRHFQINISFTRSSFPCRHYSGYQKYSNPDKNIEVQMMGKLEKCRSTK